MNADKTSHREAYMRADVGVLKASRLDSPRRATWISPGVPIARHGRTGGPKYVRKDLAAVFEFFASPHLCVAHPPHKQTDPLPNGSVSMVRLAPKGLASSRLRSSSCIFSFGSPALWLPCPCCRRSRTRDATRAK